MYTFMRAVLVMLTLETMPIPLSIFAPNFIVPYSGQL